jgi:hypothetical protein
MGIDDTFMPTSLASSHVSQRHVTTHPLTDDWMDKHTDHGTWIAVLCVIEMCGGEGAGAVRAEGK